MWLQERLEILPPRVEVAIDTVTRPRLAEVHHFLTRKDAQGARIMCFPFGLCGSQQSPKRLVGDVSQG
ncbi:hypothetical protein SVAN01_07316 [Stagonosporopsis vannaccii]|nr:hypothetical protein SVAN01_07316 [Stagonosporopsis vannaccii]